jgi:hypothetical protein
MENKARSKGLNIEEMQRLSEMIGQPIKPWSEMDESLSSISAMISFPGNSSGAKSGHNVNKPILYWSYGTGGIEFIAEDEWRMWRGWQRPLAPILASARRTLPDLPGGIALDEVPSVLAGRRNRWGRSDGN